MPPPSGHEMRFRLRRQRRFQHSFRRLTLAACELCGFVSGRRVVVKRHRRLCSRTPESSTCLSCDQCAWTGDTVRTYLDHRRATHGDHITIVKYAPHTTIAVNVNKVMTDSALKDSRHKRCPYFTYCQYKRMTMMMTIMDYAYTRGDNDIFCKWNS